ncbi:DUF6538 domain-containing protein [Qipengyuania qiaonensis]|uniref:Tyrosine-type recombinase/integrase n=1 Tax=Qipengyuania qiaonensis TaxID=2867240 RepID=A0ABS7J4X2_9SPHN|nr:DUF6538 domain-containing protein [Qipengyuania qiaonensis]MBX7482331.1 tyrosine-type recombinase/integrase [Qipengyuania qiaonensis]
MCSYLDQVGSTYYFRRAVPQDLIGFFKTQTGKARTDWKFSLRTKDRETAKRLLRPHEVETDALIDDARRTLASARDDAGERIGGEGGGDERSEALAALEAAQRARREARREGRIEVHKRLQLSTAEMDPQDAAWIDVLREKGISLEMLREATVGLRAGNKALEAQRQGSGKALSIFGLFDRYAASGSANPNTARRWRNRVEQLVEHLGHDDARRVTRADLNGWTAALVAKGLEGKTVRDGYLPAIRVAFAVAYEDGDIPTNPASGLKVRAPKPTKLRERELTDDEAATILRGSLQPQPKRLSPEHALARRWVPWLCAYTGARVSEITQLRATDITKAGDIWLVHITPEAGGVKTGEARLVPIHSHLLDQGIAQFAKTGDEAPLFYREGAGSDLNPGYKLRASDLAKWVRTLGVDAPAPNHGWRHRFKTQARIAEIPEYLADKIQGHAPATEGRKYGGSNLLVLMRNAIEKLPRFDL